MKTLGLVTIPPSCWTTGLGELNTLGEGLEADVSFGGSQLVTPRPEHPAPAKMRSLITFLGIGNKPSQ